MMKQPCPFDGMLDGTSAGIDESSIFGYDLPESDQETLDIYPRPDLTREGKCCLLGSLHHLETMSAPHLPAQIDLHFNQASIRGLPFE